MLTLTVTFNESDVGAHEFTCLASNNVGSEQNVTTILTVDGNVIEHIKLKLKECFTFQVATANIEIIQNEI